MYICSKCKGKGVYTHPFWVIYFSYYKDKEPKYVFAELYRTNIPNKLPPEKIQCEICRGKGQFDELEEKIFYELTNGKECLTYFEFKNFLKNIKKYPLNIKK